MAAHPRAAYATQDDEVSLADAIDLLLQHWKTVVGTTSLVLVVVLGLTLLRPAKYTAYAAFMPQSKQMPANLSGLAAQLGVTLPTTDPGGSPQYYLDVLRSRDILRAAVLSEYTIRTPRGVRRGTLVDFYRPAAPTQAARVDKAIVLLNGALTAAIPSNSGMVRVGVTQEYPALAAMILERLLALLSNFNVQTHQSQAAAERRFTELRRDEVHRDLLNAENAQQAFLQQNRDYRNSPALTFEQDRLQRAVATEQQLYAALSEAYEQAKIEEVRDTPVFTIVETPEPPTAPDSRGILLKGVLGIIAGVTIGLILVLAHEALTRARLLRAARSEDSFLPEHAVWHAKRSGSTDVSAAPSAAPLNQVNRS